MKAMLFMILVVTFSAQAKATNPHSNKIMENLYQELEELEVDPEKDQFYLTEDLKKELQQGLKLAREKQLIAQEAKPSLPSQEDQGEELAILNQILEEEEGPSDEVSTQKAQRVRSR